MDGDNTTISKQATTSWSLRRRTFYILLIVMAGLFGGPALAQASFTGTASAPVTVSTHVVPASTSLTGTYTCDWRGTMTVKITGFDRVPKATGYTLTLADPNNSPGTTQELTANQTTATISRAANRSGSFTLSLTTHIGTWTSKTPLTYTVRC